MLWKNEQSHLRFANCSGLSLGALAFGNFKTMGNSQNLVTGDIQSQMT